jgi:orotate phosphoribosyltransferase
MTTAEDLLKIKTIEDLSEIGRNGFWELGFLGNLTKKHFVHVLTLANALFVHNGDPKWPHAVLHSGLCSDGYINGSNALSYPSISQIFAACMERKITDALSGNTAKKINWIVSSSYTAIPLGKDVANLLNTRFGYTEKEGRLQVWRRWQIAEKETVLQVEDTITTSATTKAVRTGIREGNKNEVKFVPIIATAFLRSNTRKIEEAKVVYVARFSKIQSWPPNKCPLCKAGSKPLRPKENWAELTGK